MKILAIETSCDETAVAVVEGPDTGDGRTITLLGNALYSQIAVHAPYGGVYPNLAKREHQSNLVPLAVEALTQAKLLEKSTGVGPISEGALGDVRDPSFRASIQEFLEAHLRPDVDYIAVTHGPGLEPALWTGINFATALSKAWDIPLMGIDHMEGHIVSALLLPQGGNKYQIADPKLPLLSLLISGGHTEFVRMDEWFLYERIGETKDDAVGEAFDKVARLLGLEYPGGPKIAEFAARSREKGETDIVFPRPMAHDNTCDVSFSGLKTAVLYKLKKMEEISETDKEHIAAAFENAARDVLVMKSARALEESKAESFAVAGGVSANAEIGRGLQEMIKEKFPDIEALFPDATLTGDNAVMIGGAAYLRLRAGKKPHDELSASGSQRLA